MFFVCVCVCVQRFHWVIGVGGEGFLVYALSSISSSSSSSSSTTTTTTI